VHPTKVSRATLASFTDLPNIGPRMAGDFVALGYTHPVQLKGADPFDLYQRLCAHTNTRQDPCVLDVFISVTRFLDGEEPRAWWDFTAERKQRYRL
jgi:hypothetical protein